MQKPTIYDFDLRNIS